MSKKAPIQHGSNRKKRVIVLTVALLAIAGAAFAYWTTTGSGSGSAGSGDTVPVTVKQTSSISGLVPGGAATPLAGNFDNPNDGPVQVASVTATVTDVTEAVGETGVCNPADFVIGGTSTTSGQVPAGNGTGSWSGLTISLTNTAVNQDACKGATAVISYTAN